MMPPFPWDIRPPLPELTDDAQDDLDTRPLTPVTDDDALDAIAADLVRFGEYFDAQTFENGDDDEQL